MHYSAKYEPAQQGGIPTGRLAGLPRCAGSFYVRFVLEVPFARRMRPKGGGSGVKVSHHTTTIEVTGRAIAMSGHPPFPKR